MSSLLEEIRGLRTQQPVPVIDVDGVSVVLAYEIAGTILYVRFGPDGPPVACLSEDCCVGWYVQGHEALWLNVKARLRALRSTETPVGLLVDEFRAHIESLAWVVRLILATGGES